MSVHHRAMTPTEVRLQLHRSGYHPLPLNGKNPEINGKDWQKKRLETNPDEIRLWETMYQYAVNTGVLTKFTPCLDIDILDEEAAEEIEALVRERYEDGGHVLTRIGLPPKRAIIFRTDEPFKKINVPLIAVNETDPERREQKIEFLADGQQLAAFGIHPDTHAPYRWHGGSIGGIKREELPYIRGAEAQRLVDEIIEILTSKYGYRLKSEKKPPPADGNGTDRGADPIDWDGYLKNLIDHDYDVRFAMTLLRTGMHDGAAVNLMRALINRLDGVDPDRKQRRLNEIGDMVRSARRKIGDPPTPAELGEWSAGADPGPISPRQWLLGNQFCRGFISSLFAAGGVGKSALRLLQLISLALGRPLCGQHVFCRSRVLLISMEDDHDEVQRRVQAVLIHYGIPRNELEGWMWCATPIGRKLATQNHNDRLVGELERQIRKAVARRQPDIVALDPFIKLHSLNENDTGDMSFVCDLLTKIAVESNIAVDIPHHVHKGQITPGDADAGRGASSIRDAGRLVYTLTAMSEAEAQSFNISPDDRPSYIRLDSAKVNIAARSATATWFRIVGVPIGNATEQYPAGDTIQVAEPWSPPDAWSGVTIHTLNAILDYIQAGCRNDDGELTSERFSSGSSKDRAAWAVIPRFVPNKTEAQCRIIIKAWIRSGLLISRDYHSPSQRRDRKGLFVDDAKRPGTEVTD